MTKLITFRAIQLIQHAPYLLCIKHWATLGILFCLIYCLDLSFISVFFIFFIQSPSPSSLAPSILQKETNWEHRVATTGASSHHSRRCSLHLPWTIPPSSVQPILYTSHGSSFMFIIFIQNFSSMFFVLCNLTRNDANLEFPQTIWGDHQWPASDHQCCWWCS